MELITKRFDAKDMLFNNGLVNLYSFLQERDFDLKVELGNSFLELKVDSQKINALYFEILKEFFKAYKIVHQTKNNRWYFDEKKQAFILDKKFDTVGGQKNDLRNGVYLYKNISEFGLNRKEIESLYLDFCNQYGQKVEKEKDGTLKVPNKRNEVIVAITLDEAVERFTHYFVGGDTLNIDSKIHTFEDGQNSFQSMLKQPKNYKLDKWEALVYWFGGRVQRLYNYGYFIYPNSSDLKALHLFKEFLKISDDDIEIRDKKGETKTIGTNIDFYTQLRKDDIQNQNFYISKSKEEFEVKFFMYLFSIIYHIEEQYEKANKRRKAIREKIFNALQLMTFVVYSDDGTFKTSFDEYTKAYRLIEFFEVLKNSSVFDYLADILVTISLSQSNKEVNLNLERWSQKILGFFNLRTEYYLTSFNILKNDSKSFGKKLYEFEKLYLQYISEGEKMNVLNQSKKLGDGIGLYCAELSDKDLLFKLRSIKNYKQLVAYFKDLKFSILKNEDKAKFSKEFNDSLSEILEDIEPNWELIRDYVAIFAIDKYRSVSYAKSNQGAK